jgi:hypothetical protein
MNQAKVAATKFVRSQLRADDLAAVYQMDLRLHPLSVTSNRDELASQEGHLDGRLGRRMASLVDSVLRLGGQRAGDERQLAQLSINASNSSTGGSTCTGP